MKHLFYAMILRRVVYNFISMFFVPSARNSSRSLFPSYSLSPFPPYLSFAIISSALFSFLPFSLNFFQSFNAKHNYLMIIHDPRN